MAEHGGGQGSGRPGYRDGGLMRSGLVTTLVLAVLLAGLASLRLVHVKKRVTALTDMKHGADTPMARPGNQDMINLSRVSTLAPATPEFTAASVAPGVGMMVQQIKLQVPDRGEQPLLVSTPPAEMIKAGKNLIGAPFSVMVQSREGSRWGPAVEALAGRGADTIGNNSMPDGGEAVGVFPRPAPDTANVGVETKVSTNLSGHAMDVTVTVKNVSESPRAVTITWSPRLLAPDAGLQELTVTPPVSDFVNGKPSEHVPVAGIRLGDRSIDAEYGDLRRSYLSNGPELRIRNEADSYVLHMTALSPSIRSLRVTAARGDKGVLLRFSTAQGTSENETGTVVAPGDSLQWHIRLDAMAISTYVQPKD